MPSPVVSSRRGRTSFSCLPILFVLLASTFNHCHAEWNVRLVGGVTILNGRLEIQPTPSDPWGTVCSDLFKETSYGPVAACHSLGFHGVTFATFKSFGPGDPNSPIWLDNVDCGSTDYYLQNCSSNALLEHNCIHGDDSGIECEIPPIWWQFRLVGGSRPSRGRVEMRPMEGLPWGSVYKGYFTNNYYYSNTAMYNMRRAICRSLGWFFKFPAIRDYGAVDGPTYLYPTSCGSTDSTYIQNCTYERLGTKTWATTDQLGLDCDPWLDLDDIEFRLVNGFAPYNGRIEFRMNDTSPWRSVCYQAVSANRNELDLSAHNQDTLNAICWRLGFNNATNATFRYYGYSSTPIGMHYADCTNVTNFTECLVLPYENNVYPYCSSSDTAGLDCFPEEKRADEWQVRLVGGNNVSSGRVEMRIREEFPWGSLCVKQTNDFNLWDAVCRSLGFDGLGNVRRRLGNGVMPMYLSDIVCPSGPDVFLQNCTHRPIGDHMCYASDSFSIDCNTSIIDRETWEVQVDGGGLSGHVSFRPAPNMTWGNMCSDSLSMVGWNTICRSSGIPNATIAEYKGFGYSSYDNLYLYGLQCPSTDPNATIRNCTYRHFEAETCRIAGVDCDPVPNIPDLWRFRVVNGPDNATGRLEVRPVPWTSYGRVCSYGWNHRDTLAACRTIGHNATAPRTKYPRYYGGSGTGPLWLSYMYCPADPFDILNNCSQYQFRNQISYCYDDIAIECFPPTPMPDKWVFRIVPINPNITNVGRVEIMVDPNATNATWGSIQFSGADDNLAVLACRSAGFNTSRAWVQVGGQTGDRFNGPASQEIVLDTPSCPSNATLLQHCSWRYLNNDGYHYYDLTVNCDPIPNDPRLWQLRLVDGPDNTSGRLEVKVVPWLEWGTVCDDAFSVAAGTAACQSMGFNTSEAKIRTGYYPYGTGRIWLDDFSCSTATGKYFQNCTPYTFIRHNCGHSEDIGLECFPIPYRIRTQFVAGDRPWRGRIMVQYLENGGWGTLCNDKFAHQHVAWNAVCHAAGFTNATNARYVDYGPGPSTTPIYLDDIVCPKDAFDLNDCTHAPFGTHNCVHGEDAGVDCYPPEEDTSNWTFRFTGPNSTATAGRIELRPSRWEPWGMVCATLFNHTYSAWIAACRTMGIITTRAEPRSYGAGGGPMYLDNVNCSSEHPLIVNCSRYPLGSYYCQPADAAGVDCDPPPEQPWTWQYRLVDGTNASNGRLEMRVTPSSPWGTVCNRGIKDNWYAMLAICRTLGFPTTWPMLTNASSPRYPGPGPSWQAILLDNFYCPDTTFFFQNCRHGPLYDHDCTHGMDVTIDCYPNTTGLVPPSYPAPRVASCPAVGVEVSPAGPLTDALLRTAGLNITLIAPFAVNKSNIYAFADFFNASQRNLNDVITFSSPTTGTAEARGLAYVLREYPALAPTCEQVSSARIECRLLPNPHYILSAFEDLVVAAAPSLDALLSPECIQSGSAVIYRTVVEGVNPLGIGTAIDAIGIVATVGATGVSSVVGAAPFDVQIMAILMQSDCMSNLDRRSTRLSKYALSPFVDINMIAVTLGNIGISIAFAASQAAMAYRLEVSRRIARVDACAAVRFPSITFGITQIFFIGTCWGLFALINEGTPGGIVVAVVGLLFVLASMAAVVYLLRNVIRARFVQYTQFLGRPAYVRWLYPLGFWEPEAQRQLYGHIMNSYRDSREFFAVAPLVIGFISCLILLGLPLSCLARFITHAVFLFICACVYIVAYPKRLHLTTGTQVASLLLLSILSALSAVAYLHPTPVLELAKLGITLLQVLLILLRAVYTLVVKVLESRRWRHFRRPDLAEFLLDTEVRGVSSKAIDDVELDVVLQPLDVSPAPPVPHDDGAAEKAELENDEAAAGAEEDFDFLDDELDAGAADDLFDLLDEKAPATEAEKAAEGGHDSDSFADDTAAEPTAAATTAPQPQAASSSGSDLFDSDSDL